MNTQFVNRFELLFWNFAIRMLSYSRFTRSFLRKSYQLMHASEVASMGILLGISGVIGLFSGYLFYFLTSH